MAKTLDNLLKSTRLSTQAENDIVILKIGGTEIKLLYQTAFEIARGMRLASKMAMKHEGVLSKEWRNMCKNVVDPNERIPVHPVFRRSQAHSNIKEWSVSFQGALVAVRFDNVTMRLHYSDAFTVHVWLRRAARHAKAWAGDRSRTVTSIAHISNAEDNYRLGLH